MKVGYFGIPGSFTHNVTSREYPDAELVGAAPFRAVFEKLETGEVDEIVVPIENTLAGSIYDNYDLLDKFDFTIKREMYLKIGHMLLGTAHNIDEIREVHSHQKALEQCSDFFRDNPQLTQVIASDTASAAKFAAEQGDPTIAAIASRENADIYGLNILRSNIENSDKNYTRFLGISKGQPEVETGDNKCSLIITLAHEQGSLNKVFELFGAEGCNLTKIESRPLINKPFEYIFYLDFTFGESTDFESLIKNLENRSHTLKQIGNYQAVFPWKD
jgi:prephenate dehydratase